MMTKPPQFTPAEAAKVAFTWACTIDDALEIATQRYGDDKAAIDAFMTEFKRLVEAS